MAEVAVDGRDVRSTRAVVVEMPVERRDAHRPHALGDQRADGVVHYGGRDAGAHAKAIGQVGGRVELAPAHVNRAGVGFVKREHARVEPVHERAKRQKSSPPGGGIVSPTLMTA